jgi:allantoicase
VKISTDYDTYNQYFSENFVINVSAEAVYSEYEEPTEFKKIVKRFEDNNKS